METILNTNDNSIKKDIIYIIPAYNPSEKLLEVIELLKLNNNLCIIVNDGSNKEMYGNILNKIVDKNCIILNHEVNKGKGAALKTAFLWILENQITPIGVITLDADGQHKVTDAQLIASSLIKNPDSLILGVRQFNSNVPLRSKIGNILTRILFKIITREPLADTQTGLRGIPFKNLNDLLDIKNNRYEFELEMLIKIKRKGQKFLQVPIETIYYDNNKNSHFNPIIDSMKIYYVLLRYFSSSVISAMIDVVAFYISFKFTKNILYSLIFSRSISAFTQFIIAKKYVFYSKNNNFTSLLKFSALVIFNLLITKEIITQIIEVFPNTYPVVAKIIAESCLFVLSFVIQNYVIFNVKSNHEAFK